jgi:hypothetical protein
MRTKHVTGWRRGVLAVAGIGLAVVISACKPGDVSSVAGNGSAGSSGDTGSATAATLDRPAGLVAIPGGGFYVADTAQCTIRKVDAQGNISTVAGIAGSCGLSGDGGPATSAQIRVSFGNVNSGLALGADGSLWFSEFTAVRRIAPDGTIGTVVSGGGYVGPAGTPDGTIYIGSDFNDANGNAAFSIDRIDANGTLTTVGTGTDSVEALTAIDDDHLMLLDWTEQPAPLTPDMGFRFDELTIADGTMTSLIGPGHVNPQAGFAVAPDGTEYIGWSTWTDNGTAVPTVTPDNKVYRLDSTATTAIAGTGSPDPATGAQSGQGTTLALTPNGMAITPSGSLLISSGHVVYRLESAASAPGPS